jgi:hypothetical protein
VALSAASWRIDPAVAKDWKDLAPERRAEKVSSWRELNRVPRWVQVGQADNLLTLDLDNPLLIDALVAEVNRPGRPRVSELMPQPGDLCLRSPEGRHTNGRKEAHRSTKLGLDKVVIRSLTDPQLGSAAGGTVCCSHSPSWHRTTN